MRSTDRGRRLRCGSVGVKKMIEEKKLGCFGGSKVATGYDFRGAVQGLEPTQ